MIRPGLLVVFLFLTRFVAEAQVCNCPEALRFITDKAEANLASYQHQVVQQSRQPAYQAFKKDILALAQKTIGQKECQAVAARYFAFFRDNNASLGYKKPYPFVPADSLSLRRYFQQDKPYHAKGKPRSKHALEGRWYFQDGTQSINIVTHKNLLHDYVGVIASGDSLYWYPGQLRLELRHQQDNQYECILWSNVRVPKIYTAILRDSTLYIGRMFSFHRSPSATVPQPRLATWTAFRELSDKTNYLRVPTLQYDSGQRIDTLLRRMGSNIIRKPNLIIDLRGNRGGADWSYHGMIPFIFPKRVVPGVLRASTWASRDNLDMFAQDKYFHCKTKEDTAQVDEHQHWLKKQSGKFTEYLFHSSYYDTAYTSPAHVAIITDRYVGASAENFLLLAKESNKVITFGENTSGSMSYGNSWAADVPTLGLSVFLPASIIVVHDNRNYELTGIGIDQPLDTQQPDTWVDTAREYLESMVEK